MNHFTHIVCVCVFVFASFFSGFYYYYTLLLEIIFHHQIENEALLLQPAQKHIKLTINFIRFSKKKVKSHPKKDTLRRLQTFRVCYQFNAKRKQQISYEMNRKTETFSQCLILLFWMRRKKFCRLRSILIARTDVNHPNNGFRASQYNFQFCCWKAITDSYCVREWNHQVFNKTCCCVFFFVSGIVANKRISVHATPTLPRRIVNQFTLHIRVESV